MQTQRELIKSLFAKVEVSTGELKKVEPQEWALPFFALCEKWAEWESGPLNTTLKVKPWYEQAAA